MGHRVIQGIRSARAIQRPDYIPKPRKRKGVRGEGLRYEDKIASALPMARHSQWYAFCDVNGPGVCEIDFMLEHDAELYLLEAKLTDVPGGRAQLKELYLPVVEAAHDRTPRGVVIARSVRAEPSRYLIRTDLLSALQTAKTRGLVPSLLWLGHTPLVPRHTIINPCARVA